MSQSFQIYLKDRKQNAYVLATLYERVDAAFAKRADDLWKPLWAAANAASLAVNVPYVRQEHEHWEWERKVRTTSHMLPYPTLGIECEGDVQGLMLVQTDLMTCRLPEQSGLPLVYVYFLATAPWNLSRVVAEPRFSGVGTVFLRAAIEMSLDLDFKGRIGLHALPQAEDWYDRHGFTCLGSDSDKDGMKYYEMTARQAADFLR